jgi:hypothetical protein
MTTPALTDRILRQGKALVRAVDALGTVEPDDPFERALTRLLLAAYKRRLQGTVEAVPAWVSEQILSASERVSAERLAAWSGEN